MARSSAPPKQLSTQQAVNAAIWSVCDILRRSNCAGALQYVPELSWLLFLRIFDEHETTEAAEAAAVGEEFTPALASPYRWQDWAAPDGRQRLALQMAPSGAVFRFVNDELLPHLRGLKHQPGANPRIRVVSEVVSGVERTRVDTERNFLDILDKLDAIHAGHIDPTHMFALSQVYEGLLLKMGEKGNDGGQFFTPREVIRVMVEAVAPRPGETIYDPCCGTGGFLAEAYDHLRPQIVTADDLTTLKEETFWGREKENLIYPIALANLALHGIDQPHLWHGNTLTGQATYDGLWRPAPERFDVILTNPPFGGKEGPEAQTRFAYKTSATQVLFLQDVINSLAPGGRCAIVLDEGVLFRTNETGFVATKRKLLNECDLWAVLSLPGGVFTAAGAGVKTNLLFFTKGGPTEQVWYYDLSDLKVGKRTPLTRAAFADFFRLLPTREAGERSWTVTREEIDRRNYDLKAVNPHPRDLSDPRTPADLLAEIERQGQAVAAALDRLRSMV